MVTTRDDWSQHYADGTDFRPLGEHEQRLLAELTADPQGAGRALDVCCGTGQLAVLLADLGYSVDALDYAPAAIDRARERSTEVRWLCLDVVHDDLGELRDDYDLITVRLAVAFFAAHRTRVLRSLAARLHEGGTLVVITPLAADTPPERAGIALDEDEISVLTEGFSTCDRTDVDGLAVLVLRGPAVAFAALEKLRPQPQAVFGVAVVATDACGRVLLGRSTRGMWELPGGRVETGESITAGAVRELAEETALLAQERDAYVLAILHDDREDVRRISAVVRLTAHTGTLGLPEPHRFTRWEWHSLSDLASLGPIFAPSAQALVAVWPGILPALPRIDAYPLAASVPPVPGEPVEAARLRERMTDAVVAADWAPPPCAGVQEALRTVPRHRFTPESPLATAYDDNLAVVTLREDGGRAVSSVSAAWLQADMLTQLHLEPGMTVLEVGSGGYNAELAAHLVAPHGRVVTVDIDPYVVRRTERLCAEAGSGRVTAVLGDGSLGAPGHAPNGGYDGVVVTHNAWDIAPAWREQLAEGRNLVVPLEMHGYTRSITLERCGEVLHARNWTYCGFVRDRGAAARTTPTTTLAEGAVTLHWADGSMPDVTGLDDALRTSRHDLATGVVLPGGYSFASLQLYAATTLPGFCRLTSTDSDLVAAPTKHTPAAAMVRGSSLAYLTHVKTVEAPTPADSRWEFRIHAYGPQQDAIATEFADCVRAWDQHVRHSGDPAMTIHPAGTPDADLPPGDILDKARCRMVFQWPGRSIPTPRPAAGLDTVSTQEGA